jgi:CRISPR-associated exonuclease Cas4
LLYISGLLILAALILFWFSGRQRSSSGLPPGRVVFSDHDYWGKVEKPLYDPVLNLTGKPDYLIDHQDTIIPVEVKSTQIRGAPYDSHIYQLAAYCLLVRRTFDIMPSHGILHYPNRDIAIDYTPELEQSIISLVREIRSQERRKRVDRSHESANRCRHCGYRNICDQSLV